MSPYILLVSPILATNPTCLVLNCALYHCGVFFILEKNQNQIMELTIENLNLIEAITREKKALSLTFVTTT